MSELTTTGTYREHKIEFDGNYWRCDSLSIRVSSADSLKRSIDRYIKGSDTFKRFDAILLPTFSSSVSEPCTVTSFAGNDGYAGCYSFWITSGEKKRRSKVDSRTLLVQSDDNVKILNEVQGIKENVRAANKKVDAQIKSCKRVPVPKDTGEDNV